MKLFRQWFFFLSVLFLCSCATISLQLVKHEVNIMERLSAVDEAQVIEQENPQKARKKYEKFLTAEPLDKSITQYQEILRREFKNLQGSERSGEVVMSEQSVLSFPFVYENRLSAILKARQGLARIALKTGSYDEAEKQIQMAIEIIKTRSVSPIFMAKAQVDCYKILEDVYKKKGQEGKWLLSKLNRELMEDYLKSAEGEKDRLTAAKSERLLRRQMSSLDDAIMEVNMRRGEGSQRRADALFQNALQIASNYQQIMQQYQSSSSGDLFSTAVMPQITKQLAVQALGASQTQSIATVSPLLNAMESGIVLKRMMETESGKGTIGILKVFAASVTTVSSDEGTKSAANSLLNSLNALEAVKQRGDMESIGKATIEVQQLFRTIQANMER